MNNIKFKNCLNQIYQKYSASNGHGDKGTAHSYIEEYEELLYKYKNKNCNLLEIGIAFGHSLKMWNEYLTKSIIYVIDITKLYSDDYLNDERFVINIGDATNIDILNKFNNINFDIIIDDGSHRFIDQVDSFNIFKNKMNNGGIFIIEDVNCLDEKKQEFVDLHYNCEIIDNRHIKGRHDDVLIIYRF
jgi:hypothetical protein